MPAPTVFVSSTFFDLSQLRLHLGRFVEILGWSPMLSEFLSFPIDPDLGTITNCRRNVREYADIFVLVVGARYGSRDPKDGRSVTNVEFLEARAKGIPIYAFVAKNVLNYMEVWRTNPSLNVSSIVDTPNLFEFISSFRDDGSLWVFPFENAQDIEETLRSQLANLCFDALTIRRKLKGTGIPESLRSLSAQALEIFLTQGRGWEYYFFAQVLTDEFAKQAALRQDLELGLNFAKSEYLPTDGITVWFRGRLTDLQQPIEGATRLINEKLPLALGPPGTAGDAEQIAYVARRLADASQALLQWDADCRRVHVDDECEPLVQAVQGGGRFVANQIDDFPKRTIEALENGVRRVDAGEKNVSLEVELVFEAPDLDPALRELKLLSDRGVI